MFISQHFSFRQQKHIILLAGIIACCLLIILGWISWLWAGIAAILLLAFGAGTAYIGCKQMRQQHIYQRQLIEALMNKLEGPAVLLNQQHQAIYFNQSFAEWLASSEAQEHLSKQKQSIWYFLPDEAMPIWKKGLQQVGHSQEPVVIQSNQPPGDFGHLIWHFQSFYFDNATNHSWVLAYSHRPAVSQLIQEMRKQNEELSKKVSLLESAQTELLLAQDHLQEQQANVQALIDNSQDLIFSIDFRYRLISYNQAFMTYIRQVYNVELTPNITLIKQLPSHFIDFWRPYIDQVLERSIHLNVERQIKDRNLTLYYEVAFNPIVNKEGTTIGVAIFARNITERKEQELLQARMLQELEEQAQKLLEKEQELQEHIHELQKTQQELINTNQQLSEEEAFVRAVIDNVQEGILVIDHQHNVMLFNRSIKSFFHKWGQPLNEGIHFLSLVPNHQLEHWRRLCQRVLGGQSVNTLEELYGAYYEASFSPIIHKSQIIGACLLISGIGREAQSEILNEAEMLRRIQEQGKLKSDTEISTDKEIEDYRRKISELKKKL